MALPCSSDGACLVCNTNPLEEDKLTCKTCVAQWHVACLSSPPATMADTLEWRCPDCTTPPSELAKVSVGSSVLGDRAVNLMAGFEVIEADASLTEKEKAIKRQQLLSGKGVSEEDGVKAKPKSKGKDVFDILSGTLNCSFCIQLPERPVTTPCGHNFCLKCFQKWTAQGKRTCVNCRSTIPPKMASQPRINSALVMAIRMAKVSKNIGAGETSRVYRFVHNQDRPDKAYTTERAQRKGKSNAASGKIFVTVPQDHFGPIPAENDPARNQGVLVGECWEDRLECRQWGAHFPHVSGIAGQSNYGAQSVVLSGGYVDDEDHGEYFLYTGRLLSFPFPFLALAAHSICNFTSYPFRLLFLSSPLSGGRDLSGNKRTNNTQSFDQKFEKSNLALKLSCLKGYPVRVVRSHKEKRSSYAPEKGLRYDGVYRIEKCWRKLGLQGFKVCRYLFVRCDNEPAPWTSDDHGDRPRPLPVITELKEAIDLTERKENPSWDYDEEESCWKWKKPPPPSQRHVKSVDPKEIVRSRREIRKAQNVSIRERLLRGMITSAYSTYPLLQNQIVHSRFGCLICKQVMVSPVTTPCAHNFCKSCLEGAFAGQAFVKERSRGGRSLRSQKNVMTCPGCPTDIADFLQNIQINTELKGVIESLKAEAEENGDSEELSDGDGGEEECDETDAAKDENKENSVNKLNDSTGIEVEAGESGVAIEVPDSVGKCNVKRKRGDAKEVSPTKTRGKRGREAEDEDEGNDSPSSPLHLPSDQD
ncbi:E3 ubiquitin-protein ligase ORTHRUS 2-like [Senna tora]|uniref:RING-type E3 ubiquitin transferase n=1 Tax=Senna tora TaxID=362788 RepID=A0A834X2V5_9FABA|nr:E3 ubiquitin-protein ligase ORTHRUS 2-like [Senna tora]